MSQAKTIIISALVTFAFVSSGFYLWQKSGKQNTEVKPSQNFTLEINQKSTGGSALKLKDSYIPDSGFSLDFPASWGLVNVTKRNLTDTDTGFRDGLKQYVSYTFTSEFKPHSNSFSIIISNVKFKDNSMVTQNNREYIAESAKYFYNYESSADYCLEMKDCLKNEIPEIKQEVSEIIKTFKLL